MSVSVPRDWEVGPGAGKIGSVASDLYRGPTLDGFQTTVNILAQNLPQGITDTPGFFRSNFAALQATGVPVQLVGSVQVGVSRATLVHYSAKQANSDQTYEVYQVAFVAGNRGWVMTVTAAPRAADAGLADFKSMLQSFRTR